MFLAHPLCRKREEPVYADVCLHLPNIIQLLKTVTDAGFPRGGANLLFDQFFPKLDA